MAELTPLMKQFWDIKNQHLDKILLFRMGDFYEMFHDDARTAAPILNIALTSRNKKAEDDTPMCGVPHHSIAGPIGKLLQAGLKVAICDQLEDPETAKGIVKRGVTRILTPGMVYDPESLDQHRPNYVAALDEKTVSFVDASTGECFYVEAESLEEKNEIFSRWHPVEILITEEQRNLIGQLSCFQNGETVFRSEFNSIELNWPERFKDSPLSAKRLLTYATQMQGVNILSTLRSFFKVDIKNTVTFGSHVARHLELFESYRGTDRGSLFYAINRTKTSAGARLLQSWLRAPLVDRTGVNERLDQVQFWHEKPSDLKILRQTLAQMGDIERRLAKISYSNCHIRDLGALKESLRVGLAISPLCPKIKEEDVSTAQQLVVKIESRLAEELPLNMKNGGYIRPGCSAQLDEYITLSENAQSLLLELETREKNQTQISSLKIRFNNVFGYYIEVTNTHRDRVPDHYKRKQTLANAERYITQELQELEEKILASREKRLQLEERIFQELRTDVLTVGPILLRLAEKWSELDVQSSLAWLAIEQKYVRPEFHEMNTIDLKGARHPVVEQEVQRRFVPNDLLMNHGDCILLTGPNMAGKSTLMRQVALVSILGQMGSFVPASSAKLPIFKKIYTRIGASDSLSEGLSTFMVEMRETAEMLEAADPNTLVILDEVGRGMSTFDGMSLAQAILEYLTTKAKCVTLFATHYHEITALAQTLPQIQNLHMAVKEESQDIRFLYTLKAGPANKSYGIQVARLAGLPASIVERADKLLKLHESRNKSASQDLPLLAYALEQET